VEWGLRGGGTVDEMGAQRWRDGGWNGGPEVEGWGMEWGRKVEGRGGWCGGVQQIIIQTTNYYTNY